MKETTMSLVDLLEVVTGKSLQGGGLDSLYRVMDFLYGDSLLTHELAYYAAEASAEIVRQIPEFGKLDFSGVKNEPTAKAFVDSCKARMSDQYRLEGGTLKRKQDPMTTLREMVGPEKPIIAVSVERKPF